MKCTNKHRKLLCLFVMAAVLICGCGQTAVSYENPYPVYNDMDSYALGSAVDSSESFLFAKGLCVADDADRGIEDVSSDNAEAAGVFNLTRQTVEYAKNIYARKNPASTTKVMTAYLALKYGDPSSMVTVSENAANQESDSSVCGLEAGDVISLGELLYGLMLVSGNDAAIAVAEHISGTVEDFCGLMNEEALLMGATATHFTNPNGLTDENHYTTVYDMYLIFQNAVREQRLLDLLGTEKHTAHFTRADGTEAEEEWENTNRYITGTTDIPEGITVLGGKTGTTKAAGHCLVLLAKNAAGDSVVSIVFKAGGRDELYGLMYELLVGFAN